MSLWNNTYKFGYNVINMDATNSLNESDLIIKEAKKNKEQREILEKIDELKEMIERQHHETQKIKRNELREKLLSSYRYYTSLEKNPSQSWNEMEAEAFWHSYSDYEELKGNGYMHTVVKPAMEKLIVTKI